MITLFLGGRQDYMEIISSKFAQGIPNAIMALLIFIVGLIFAKIFAKVVEKALKKTKIDKLGERLGDIDLISKSNIDIAPSKVISSLIYYFLLIVVAMISAEILNLPIVSQLISNIVLFFPNIVVAIILLVLGIIFSDAMRRVVQTTCESLGIPAAKVIAGFVFYFIFISILLSALSQLQINTEFLGRNISIIIGGAVFAFAIGYGLASRETVSSFLTFRNSSSIVKVGDKIKIEDIEGTVVGVDKSTLTIDCGNKKVFVPMHKLSNHNIEIFN